MFGPKKFNAKELGRRLAAYAGTRQDQRAWRRWLKTKRRSWQDFRLLLKNDPRPVFRARALTAMLTWDHSRDPFRGRVLTEFKETGLYASSVEADCLACQPDVAAVVVMFCLEAIDSGVKVPKPARDLYNRCIPTLLACLKDEALGEELFNRFRLLDCCAPWSDFDDCSGYNIFDSVFFVNGLSDAWKIRIDALMRAIVLSELEGRSRPRAEHEAADAWYAHALFIDLPGEMNRPIDLLEDEAKFIVSWTKWSPQVLREVRLMLDLFSRRMIDRDGPGTVCHALMRRAVLEGVGKDAFLPCSDTMLNFSLYCLERYPEDLELTARLRRLTDEYGPKLRAAAGEEDVKKAREIEAPDRLC